MKKTVLALGATALAFAPVAASAVESAQSAPAIAPVEAENVAGAPSVLIAIFVAAAVIGGVVIASSEGDGADDLPVSG